MQSPLCCGYRTNWSARPWATTSRWNATPRLIRVLWITGPERTEWWFTRAASTRPRRCQSHPSTRRTWPSPYTSCRWARGFHPRRCWSLTFLLVRGVKASWEAWLAGVVVYFARFHGILSRSALWTLFQSIIEELRRYKVRSRDGIFLKWPVVIWRMQSRDRCELIFLALSGFFCCFKILLLWEALGYYQSRYFFKWQCVVSNIEIFSLFINEYWVVMMSWSSRNSFSVLSSCKLVPWQRRASRNAQHVVRHSCASNWGCKCTIGKWTLWILKAILNVSELNCVNVYILMHICQFSVLDEEIY